jgi:hypothetical protein
MRVFVVVALLVGCWTHSRVPDPPRLRATPVPELLPDGAWLVAALDVDLDSPAQRAHEERARRDPAAARNADGTACQFFGTHIAFALYDGMDGAVVVRAGYRIDALRDCLALAAKHGAVDDRIAGHDVLRIRGEKPGDDMLIALTASGVILGTSSARLMARAFGDDLAPATADPHLAELIARARAGGELWIAARLPRKAPFVDDILGMLGAKLAGRVVSVVASVHVGAPYRVAVMVAVETPADAAALARVLEDNRRRLNELVDDGLKPIADSLAVRVDGTNVVVIGEPHDVDWLKAYQGLLALVARIRG